MNIKLDASGRFDLLEFLSIDRGEKEKEKSNQINRAKKIDYEDVDGRQHESDDD